jgi:hypothetical protein
MKEAEQQDGSKSRLYGFILNYVMLPTYLLQICILTTYIAAWYGINQAINQSEYKYHVDIARDEYKKHATAEANTLLIGSFDVLLFKPRW